MTPISVQSASENLTMAFNLTESYRGSVRSSGAPLCTPVDARQPHGLLAAGLGMENAPYMNGYGSGEKLQHAGAGQAFMDGMHPNSAQVRPLAAPETDSDSPAGPPSAR